MDRATWQVLFGRPALPAGIVGTTTVLASPAFDDVTRRTLMVDGGIVLT